MKKVLLVEDEKVLSEALQEALELAGFEVILATDGLEAFSKLETIAPEVIISDLKMPNIDGMGLLALVRKNKAYNHIPYIVISARTDSNDIRAAMNLGADDYLTKPFTITALIESVNARVNRIESVTITVAKAPTSPLPTITEKGIEKLSKREYSILLMVGNGETTKQIAEQLFISHKTVLSHKRNIMEKLGLSGFGSLLAFAINLKKSNS
jgi:DNA-binding NarL/FixJ family response regulator